jgi:hypothetical protein
VHVHYLITSGVPLLEALRDSLENYDPRIRDADSALPAPRDLQRGP